MAINYDSSWMYRQASLPIGITPIKRPDLDLDLSKDAAPALKLIDRELSHRLYASESILEHIALKPGPVNIAAKLKPVAATPLPTPQKLDIAKYEKALNSVLVKKLKDTRALKRIDDERSRLSQSKRPNWLKRKGKHIKHFFKRHALQDEVLKDHVGTVRLAAQNARGLRVAAHASSANVWAAITSGGNISEDSAGVAEAQASNLSEVSEILDTALAPVEPLLMILTLGIALKELEGNHTESKKLKKAYAKAEGTVQNFAQLQFKTAASYKQFLENSKELFKACGLYESCNQSLLKLLESPMTLSNKKAIDQLLEKNLTQVVQAFEAHKKLGHIKGKHYQREKALTLTAMSRAAAAASSGIISAIKAAPPLLAKVGAYGGAVASYLAVPLYLYRAYKDHKDMKVRENIYGSIKLNQEMLDKISDQELKAIIALVKKQNRTVENRVSLFSNTLEAAGHMCAGTLGLIALLAEVGVISAGAGLAVTPVGWAIGGTLGAVAIGWLGYKIGKAIYKNHEKKKWQSVLQHEGKHFEKLKASYSIEDIDRIAHEKLIKRSKTFALGVLYETLLTEHQHGLDEPAKEFLKTVGLSEEDVLAVIRSADREVATELLAERLNFA